MKCSVNLCLQMALLIFKAGDGKENAGLGKVIQSAMGSLGADGKMSVGDLKKMIQERLEKRGGRNSPYN